MKKVLLLSMPFGALERQALGLSLLKAQLTELHIACDIRYLNFPFAELIGYEDYQLMLFEMPYIAFAGDWSFTAALYGDRPSADRQYIQEVLQGIWQLDESVICRVLRIRSLVPYFLDHCMRTIAWENYTLVGFTSTFEQNIASLALAKRIKAAYPDIAIVFGGANWEADMGQELHRQFPCVDYVCSGEAEQSFPALVQQVFTHGTVDRSDKTIPGIVYRANGVSVTTGQALLTRDMDALPIPDFRDYFAALERSTVAALVQPLLLMETARGCWWGAKSHCTFCGLNGGAMAFRSKSATRALDELAYLVDQWRIDAVEVVDNILDMKYFQTMLPALAGQKRSIQLFYETKANLNRQHLQILYDAGVYRIQPGIESMSDHVLQLMRKGTTALRNIQLLKLCQEYHITAEWNILYGFPSETPQDYTEMLQMLPAIRHLRPPAAVGPVRLDRFSPYFNTPEKFGLVNVRPISPYKYLYPVAEDSLRRIAYYFDYDYTQGINPAGYAADVIRYTHAWQHEPEKGTLSAITQADGTLLLHDTRSNALLPELQLSGLEQAVYEYCDDLHSVANITQYLRQRFPEVVFTVQHLVGFLDSLVANRLMVADGKHYLSVAIPLRTVQPVLVGATSASYASV